MQDAVGAKVPLTQSHGKAYSSTQIERNKKATIEKVQFNYSFLALLRRVFAEAPLPRMSQRLQRRTLSLMIALFLYQRNELRIRPFRTYPHPYGFLFGNGDHVLS